MADDVVEMDVEVVEEDSQSTRPISSDTETTFSQNSNHNQEPIESNATCTDEVQASASSTAEPIYICDSCKNSDKNIVSTNKRHHSDEDEDDGKQCPICFDVWTNSGEHRLCAIRCGHLFGHSCLVRWLQGQRTCPTCKSAVRKTDIRFIYARRLIAQDTGELNVLRKQIADHRVEQQKLELQRVRDSYEIAAQKEQISILKTRLRACIGSVVTASEANHSAQPTERRILIFKEGEIKFTREGGCRVMAYNRLKDTLAVSMMSANALFTGYGVRKINARDLRMLSYTGVHSKPIRDLAYHPERQDWLLSVSLDKSARLIDDLSRHPVLNIPGEHPLWSCCWDTTNPHYFYAGMSNGSVCKHDVRKADLPVMTNIAVPNDQSPVVSLANISAGLLVCKLCSCWLLERWPEAELDEAAPFPGQHLPLEGPFVSMCYDNLSDNVLVSTRPNQAHSYSRHSVCKVGRGPNGDVSCKTVHVFSGAPTQKLMTRSCQVNIGDGEVLVAANQEAQKAVHIWSLSSARQIGIVSSYEPALDLCHVPMGNQHNFAVLNEQKISMYRFDWS